MASPMQMPLAPNKNKQGSSASAAAAESTAMAARPAEHGLRCPRCDSANTKFCYYNNYSLTQPRHFCKTCRRYWTKGGALRNVPIGGGCRKSKKSSSKSSSSSSASGAHAAMSLSSALPQLCLGGALPYDNYALAGGGIGIASSIESLSSINQDLHWKLQQQRLQAMLYGGGGGGDQLAHNKLAVAAAENQHEVDIDQNACFHQTARVAAEDSTTDDISTTAWFLENPYSMHNVTTTSHHHHHHAAANHMISTNNNSNNASDWSGMQTWSDVHQFAALPQGKSTHGLIS